MTQHPDRAANEEQGNDGLPSWGVGGITALLTPDDLRRLAMRARTREWYDSSAAALVYGLLLSWPQAIVGMRGETVRALRVAMVDSHDMPDIHAALDRLVAGLPEDTAATTPAHDDDLPRTHMRAWRTVAVAANARTLLHAALRLTDTDTMRAVCTQADRAYADALTHARACGALRDA